MTTDEEFTAAIKTAALIKHARNGNAKAVMASIKGGATGLEEAEKVAIAHGKTDLAQVIRAEINKRAR